MQCIAGRSTRLLVVLPCCSLQGFPIQALQSRYGSRLSLMLSEDACKADAPFAMALFLGVAVS